MTYYEIPLTPTSQSFFTTIAGVQYQFTITWRDAVEGGWFLDIADQNANQLVSGIPLITGADLLEQYTDLNFGFTLSVASDVSPSDPPTFTNLGISSHLYVGLPS